MGARATIFRQFITSDNQYVSFSLQLRGYDRLYHDFLHFLSFVRHFGSLRWGKLQTDGSEDAQDGGEVHRRELWEIVEKRLSSSPGLLDIFLSRWRSVLANRSLES